jgi:hypothetical protein
VPPASQFQARQAWFWRQRIVRCHDAAPLAQSPARTDTPATYELRTYKLILGYNPVPELRAAFCAGCARCAVVHAAVSSAHCVRWLAGFRRRWLQTRRASLCSCATLTSGACAPAGAAALLALTTDPAVCSELNNVVELWRYPTATACMAARQAAREAPEWRAAVGRVAPMVQVCCCLHVRTSRKACLTQACLPHAELHHAVPQSRAVFAVAVAGEPARIRRLLFLLCFLFAAGVAAAAHSVRYS